MDLFNKAFDDIMKPKFSKEFIRDVNSVWQSIASDASEFCEDNESAVELCIDANRLALHGLQASEDELKRLIQEHGYKMVLRELSKSVSLY